MRGASIDGVMKTSHVVCTDFGTWHFPALQENKQPKFIDWEKCKKD
jgi:hypothetical protein